MGKRANLFLILLLLAGLLAACGDSATPTTSSATTAAGSATSAATTAAATANPATAVATIAATTAASASGQGFAPMPELPALPATAKKGGTFTIANSGPLAQDIPATPNTRQTVAAWHGMYRLIWAPGLMSYNFTTLQWQLEMAQDLKVDESGKVLTFTLRPNLKWSDGSPLTVEDFQFTFDNISKPNKENPTLNYARLADTARVASFKSDPATATITVTLNQAYARDLALYYSVYPVVPKKVWDGKPYFDSAANPEHKKPTVVSGPYMVESYDPAVQAVLVPNPNWYRGKPNFDKVIVKPFAANLLYEALKNGQADFSWDVLPPAQFNEVKGNANIKTYEWTSVTAAWRYLTHNMTRAPFNDKALRQAIAFALDRDALIKLSESGRAQQMHSFLPDTSPNYYPEVPRYNFSLDKAKKVLEDAGYKLNGGVLSGKDGQPVKFTILYEVTDPISKLVVTYMQAQLKSLGMDVQVDGREPQAYLSTLIGKNYDIATGVTGMPFPDPDTAKFWFTSDGVFNTTGFKNERVDELFKLGASEQDAAKRKGIYNELQKILSEELPLNIMYARVPFLGASSKLGGLTPPKAGRFDENAVVASWFFNQ